MKRIFFLAVCLLLGFSTTPSANAQNKEHPVVFLAGDSTCAPRQESARPKWGWGEKLELFLDGYTVVNKAVGGMSTKSFRDRGMWDKLIGQVEKGDVVLIQFGHNDEKVNSEEKYAEAFTDYYRNLCRFVAEVREKEAVPVILTSVSRRHFKSGEPRRTHGDYPAAAIKAASDCGVVLLDIEETSFQWLEELGDEESAKRFMFSVDGKDNTHFVELGATEVAEMVAKALKECGDPYLSSLVK
ncbi:MAG: rhamnogalacturonan acetylesterase [Bacteroidales bacterium]|nr:rhamnogalacturonan acetylesterase [Bacteroidales bacterium]